MAPTPNPEITAHSAFHWAVCDAEAVYAIAARHDERGALDALSAAMDAAYDAYDAAVDKFLADMKRADVNPPRPL